MTPGNQGPAVSQGELSLQTGPFSGRIPALDGLRGLAAFIVVVFHFLCLLVPTAVTGMTAEPLMALVHTPLSILWDGRFAVSVFFVLSGFVMAAAAERRHDMLITNTVTRYLRLAVPVTASVVLAWVLLSLFPTATFELRDSVENPSRWMEYTHQGHIPSLLHAGYDGLARNFLTGGSRFNNVLWTMQIEFIGSIALFALYWFSAGRMRIVILCGAGMAILGVPEIRPDYFAFVLGALMYEAYVRGRIHALGPMVPPVALAVGIVFGAAGPDALERWGLEGLMPTRLKGAIPVTSAALIMYAVITMAAAARFFSLRVLRWLGRISFGLYLVHVPLLYTLVAYAHGQLGWGFAVLVPAYFSVTLALAHLFTVGVDEPTLRQLKRFRRVAERFDRPWVVSRVA
jgi:peptidoglycan/LPS O-acetylase OafA/YrhL